MIGSLGVAVLVLLAFRSSRKDGEQREESDAPNGLPAAEDESGDGTAAGDDPATTVVELKAGASRERETPTSTPVPVVDEDWISAILPLSGTLDVEALIRVIERLAAGASISPESESRGRISFTADPRTLGEYSTPAGSVDGNFKVETTRISISTRAPQGHAIEEPCFDRRELAFEFDRSSEFGTGAPPRITRFSCQVNLVGRELGPMTPAERDRLYGTLDGPAGVGFVVACTEEQMRIDKITLKILPEDDGTWLACLVGGDGQDAVVISSSADQPFATVRWQRCIAALDRWRHSIDAGIGRRR